MATPRHNGFFSVSDRVGFFELRIFLCRVMSSRKFVDKARLVSGRVGSRRVDLCRRSLLTPPVGATTPTRAGAS